MRVRLLGPIDVTVEGVHRPVRGLRRKAVLAALAVHRGQVVSTDRIAEVVWGAEPPSTATNTLQHHVAHLRQVLGSRDAILARPPGYMLPLDTDVAVAERLIQQGTEATDPVQRIRHLRAALALWRGRSLGDVVGRAGLDAEADRLDDLWLVARQALVDNQLHLGEHAQVVPDLERMTRDHPHDERFHAQLMLAQYRAGRPADALATYQRLKRTLADDLGLDPGPALRDLEAAILRQDPVLDLAAPPVTVAGPRHPAPAQLPLAVRGFTGHADALARLDAMVPQDGVVVCAVSGPPGVGKTSLAVHWAHRVADRFPDGQLYVNLRGFDPHGAAVDPAEALRGFLDAFRVPADRVPASVDAQATLYRSVLAGKRVLVVLDNARDAEQVRPLLPGTAGCLVVVTSRDRLTPLVAAEGAHSVALDVLSAAEARDLLAVRLGADRVAAEPDAVADLIGRCGRLPLALAVAAAHAATQPSIPLDTLDAFDGGVRAVFSWSYRALPAGAARLFRLIGLHPTPDLAAPAAASLAGLPLPQVRPLLRHLVQANLLVEHTPGRYRCHDLLHNYAQELAHPADAEALRRMLDHYLHSAHAAVLFLDPARTPISLDEPQPGVTVTAPADPLAWFVTEHAALVAAVHLSDHHAWALAWSLTTYFDWRGHWRDLIITQRAAITALVRLGDRSGQAHAYRDLGRTLAQRGDHSAARDHLDAALRLYEQLGDVTGQARTHHNLGWLRQAQGHHREALAHSEAAFALFETAGDTLWQARTLNAAGWLHAQLGDQRRTLDLCGQALTLMRRLQDRHGEAGTWDSIGFAHHHLADHTAASRCYRRAIDLFAELGDRGAEAEVLLHLGDTHDASGDPHAARVAWRRALDLFTDLDHPGAADAHHRLAR
jgi:DNA-binding SARP family transcriptional activator/tetratricopeptide (TPR) repeat protein